MLVPRLLNQLIDARDRLIHASVILFCLGSRASQVSTRIKSNACPRGTAWRIGGGGVETGGNEILSPVDEVPDPGAVGRDEAALDAEREAVGALEAEEVGGDRRELPQHHPGPPRRLLF
jgi:hypothetical protein